MADRWDGPRRILMHVGHGKTGSSYLQSTLAGSIDVLDKHDIAYPLDEDEIARVSAGGISAGNLKPSPRGLQRLPTTPWRRDAKTLLLSSEVYFNQMRPSGFMEQLRKQVPDAEFHALIYVRDPLDHAVSKYHQSVKRGGYTSSFEKSLEEYKIPARTANYIKWLEGEMGVTVTALNYSRHRNDLIGSFEKWLNVPCGALVKPTQGRINRSLTNGELEVQRLFNKHFGSDAGKFVSDVLCDGLPDIKSEQPSASAKAIRKFLKRMQSMIDRVGMAARLGESESYYLPDAEDAIARFTAPEGKELFSFSAEQLALLVDSLHDEIQRSASGEGVVQLLNQRTQ